MSFLFYERDLFGFESEIQRPMRGPKSGRVYRRKSVVHRASAPGEAPAIDTGILRFSIAVKIGDSGLSATIGVHELTKVKYARPLEFGTQKMAARPFVFPALEKNKKAAATFKAFSPSNKREYVEWITEAKREATREKRLAQAIEWMAEGKPRNWKYMKKR